MNTRWVAIAMGGLALLLAGFTGLLWKIGMFDFSGSDSSAKIVASAIALVGALVGSLTAVWRTETEQRTGNGVGLCLAHIVEVYSPGWELYPPNGMLSIDALRSELGDDHERMLLATTREFRILADEFASWVAGHTVE